MLKFWKWLYFFAKEKYCESYLDKYGFDCKCPNCNEWQSITQATFSELGFGTYRMNSNQCGTKSEWLFDIVPFPVLLDEIVVRK